MTPVPPSPPPPVWHGARARVAARFLVAPTLASSGTGWLLPLLVAPAAHRRREEKKPTTHPRSRPLPSKGATVEEAAAAARQRKSGLGTCARSGGA